MGEFQSYYGMPNNANTFNLASRQTDDGTKKSYSYTRMSRPFINCTMVEKEQAPPPANVGTKHNLPAHIREIAKLRSQVIAWTRFDPELEGYIGCNVCCRMYSPFVASTPEHFPWIMRPCCWPHMILFAPCLLWYAVNGAKEAKSQYWILTEQELKIVTTEYDLCCCPGISTSGNSTKSIPLENITDCGTDAPGKGCTNKCTAELPSIYVDTARSSNTDHSKGGHEAHAIGLAGSDWFIQEILNRRDMLKNHHQQQQRETIGMAAVTTDAIDEEVPIVIPVVSVEPIPPPIMDRGDIINDPSIADRIRQIDHLYESGLLTKKEYDKKKEDIIASI